MNDPKISALWKWFQLHAEEFQIGEPDGILMTELHRLVQAIDRGLTWEIGPGAIEPRALVITPTLNRNLRSLAQAIIAAAPEMRGWEFYSLRPPKRWPFNLEFEANPGEQIRIDASTWKFLLVPEPDSTLQIFIEATDLPEIDDDTAYECAELILTAILGEAVYFDQIDSFAIASEWPTDAADYFQPLTILREAVNEHMRNFPPLPQFD